MKKLKVQGLKESSLPIIVNKDLAYIHENIVEKTTENGVIYEYDETQMNFIEYCDYVLDHLDLTEYKIDKDFIKNNLRDKTMLELIEMGVI